MAEADVEAAAALAAMRQAVQDQRAATAAALGSQPFEEQPEEDAEEVKRFRTFKDAMLKRCRWYYDLQVL